MRKLLCLGVLCIFFVVVVNANDSSFQSQYLVCIQQLKDCNINNAMNVLGETTSFGYYKELVSTYSAYYDTNYYKTITKSKNKKVIDLATTLKRPTVEATVEATQNWIAYNMIYEYYYSPRKITDVLTDYKGDCTENAELYYQVLTYNDIIAKKVRGYEMKDGKMIKHDWVEVLYPASGDWLYWRPIEAGVKRKGDGLW